MARYRCGLFAAILCALSTVAHVQAQMSGDLMRPTSPDWSSSRAVAMLALQGVMLPCYLLTLVLLYRRRKLYPISGRNAWLLLLLNGSSLIGSAAAAAAHLAYRDGMPCAMLLIMSYLFVPCATVMMVRGYLLVFRLEIQAFLAELAWRKSKIQRLLQRQAVSESKEAPSPPADIAAAGQAAETVTAAASGGGASTDTLSLPSLDPSTLPGHFCISNRRFMEARWILAGLTVAGAAIALPLTLTAIFDPDVRLTNAWRESHGLPRDTPENQFGGGAFFEGHRCLVYSIKFASFDLAMLLAFPFVMLMAWRVRVNSRRMEQRAQEQAEFEAVMRATASHDAEAGGPDAIDPPTPLAGSVAAALQPTHTAAVSATELNELAAVKLEMGSCLAVGGAAIAISLVLIDTAYEWTAMEMAVAFAAMWALTAVPALHASYRVAHQQREMLLRARRDTKHGSKGGRLIALVPHHRPLYRLAHIISDPHTYPVLLKFLQKEYSSENALFYLEARKFARECRAAERRLPGWSSSLDEDDDSHTNMTDGSAPQSLISADASNRAGGTSIVGIGTLEPPREDTVEDFVAASDGASTAGATACTTSAAAVEQPYTIFEPLRNDDDGSASSDADSPDVATGPSLMRLSSFRPTQPRAASAGSGSGSGNGKGAHFLMVSIRVEQPGSSDTVDESPSVQSPLDRPSLSVSPPPCMQTRSMPVSPCLVPASPSLMPSAQGTPAALSRVGVELGSLGFGLGMGLGPSPLSSSRSTSGRAVSPSPTLSTTQCAPVSRTPAQRFTDRRGSSPFSVREAAPTQARPELAWGPPAVPTVTGAHPKSAHSPMAPRPASRASLMQRQQTRAARKLFAPQVAAAAKAAQAAAPKLAPLSFRQMHEMASTLRAQCLRLHGDYLRANSVYQINIDNDLAKMVSAQIAQVDQWQPTPLTADGQPDLERAAMESASPPPPPFPLSSLYQQTALAVFNLMETDSFRRFLLTSDFEQLLQRADDQEMERIERQAHMAADTTAVLAHAEAALHAHAESAISLAAAAAPPSSVEMAKPALQVGSSHSAATAVPAQARDSAAHSR